MGDQYLGEIRMVGFNFAPQGWALCNGQLMPINTYQALFALLGTEWPDQLRAS
jgi:microcystin-dependent protein